MSRRATDMRAREQGFLWDGLLPIGHMAVIAGSPRMGKSTLGYRIAADCGVPTLFVTTEEADETVWLPRLLAAGVDPDKAFSHPEVRFTRSPVGVEYLRELIDRYGIKLIVVDPIQQHLDASTSHDQAVRSLMAPYIDLMQEKKVALLLEAHVLKDVNKDSDPLLAVPGGLRGWAKAVYLFGRDPTLGADPDLRILACAKFNFGKEPSSLRFEFDTKNVSVIRVAGGGRVTREYGMWINRGPVPIKAKALLVHFAPETNERKLDRVAQEIITFLRKGKDGRMQPAAAVKKMSDELDPPINFRTTKRAAEQLGIEREQDPNNKRLQWWVLPEEILGLYEEATEEDDEIIIEEVEIPDTVPEDWSDEG